MRRARGSGKGEDMKLFIWLDPYHVSYGASILYVIAGTEEKAREHAMTSIVMSYGTPNHPPEIYCAADLPAPTRVIELTPEQPAYAEIYEWSE